MKTAEKAEIITISLLFKTFRFMNNQNSGKDLIGTFVGINKNIQINFLLYSANLNRQPFTLILNRRNGGGRI
jgi:hypothetical protein